MGVCWTYGHILSGLVTPPFTYHVLPLFFISMTPLPSLLSCHPFPDTEV
jgi:hypothetical protein